MMVLMLQIVSGIRPPLPEIQLIKEQSGYVDLINMSWQSDPLLRPTADQLTIALEELVSII